MHSTDNPPADNPSEKETGITARDSDSGPHSPWLKTIRQARRVVAAVVGFTLLAVGIAMLVTPGPGLLVIFLGLSALAAEFVWARRLLDRLKKRGAALGEKIFGKDKGAVLSERIFGKRKSRQK
ncbi:MAG: PGPGW domain-containing protein [Candidatus Binataceae bacterium]